jgi:hypothetical protein
MIYKFSYQYFQCLAVLVNDPLGQLLCALMYLCVHACMNSKGINQGLTSLISLRVIASHALSNLSCCIILKNSSVNLDAFPHIE